MSTSERSSTERRLRKRNLRRKTKRIKSLRIPRDPKMTLQRNISMLEKTRLSFLSTKVLLERRRKRSMSLIIINSKLSFLNLLTH
jgi:hypothetical protein